MRAWYVNDKRSAYSAISIGRWVLLLVMETKRVRDNGGRLFYFGSVLRQEIRG